MARVQAMLRRAGSTTDAPAQEQTFQFGPFHLYCDRYLLTRNGQRIPLSSKEFSILAHLVRNAGIPLTAQAIYRDVWGRAYGDISAVAVYIQRLRRKIEDNPSVPAYIENIHGLGYQFNIPPQEDGSR